MDLRNGDRMEEMKFILMHKDVPISALTIDSGSGAIMRVSKPVNPELLPMGGNIDANSLKKWWQYRAVPMSQGKIVRVLEKLGFASTQRYLVKNLGLSLNDHYWIKPLEMDLQWKDVNLFTNDFTDPVGEVLFQENIDFTIELPVISFSPSSSLQGDLRKKWIISNGKRCLIKGNRGSNSQESLNECVATMLHKKQECKPFVTYSVFYPEVHEQACCICESFTSDTLEFIPAFDVIESRKKNNSCSVYEHFIQVCASYGLDDDITRSFLEYQILTDYVITNTDRHLKNFGVLRDTNTLKFVGMAPIFDSGNSMFWNNPRYPMYGDMSSIEVNSFRGKEKQLLQYLQGDHQIDVSKLPSKDELKEVYSADPTISYLESILLGYEKKIDFLCGMVR